MCNVEQWRDRLDEATVRLHPEVTAEACAERYDVPGDRLEEFTNRALDVAFDGGYGTITLADLDTAAAEMEVRA